MPGLVILSDFVNFLREFCLSLRWIRKSPMEFGCTAENPDTTKKLER